MEAGSCCAADSHRGEKVVSRSKINAVMQACKDEHRLGGLAISYTNWKEAVPREGEGEEGWWRPGSMEAAWLYGNVREVLIVVNGEEAAANRHRDIVFAEPSFEPWRILPGQRAMHPNDRTDISWKRWRVIKWLR
jgi:hypothetical protein